MAQLVSATFITDSGFATGLTPTVKITELVTGTVKGTFNMEEVGNGNYKYNYVDGSDQLIYFFNFDAGDANVTNRYQGATNSLESVVRGGGTANIIKNNVIGKKQIDDIANRVKEVFPVKEEINLDKIELKLEEISKKEFPVTEFDYSIILDAKDAIISKIDGIKIPKYDDKKVISGLKVLQDRVVDLKPIQDKFAEVSSKIDNVFNEIKNDKNNDNKTTIENLKKIQTQLKEMELEIEDTTNSIEESDNKCMEELMQKEDIAMSDEKAMKDLLK